ALRRGAAGCGAAPRGEARALEGILPDGLLPARRDHAGRGGRRLALPLSSAPRSAESAARARGHPPERLAGRPALGHARHHPARRVEELRLQHGDLHRRPAEHSRAALRGGAAGRRERLAAVPPGHAADARADVPVRRRRHHDRLLPTVRRALRHDPGRTGEQHAQRRPPHVRGGLPLVEHGLRRRRRLRALRDHRLAHAGRARAPAAPAGGAMRRTVQAVALHGVLAFGAALTLLPLLWMLAASLMPAGEASAVPPRLVPSAVTLEHYRALFARLHLTRSLLNSAGLATAVTVVSLLLNSMAGYAFAKLRFAGRDRLFRLVLFLCAPVLVTLAVFTFMGTWNDFMWPLIVLADDRLYTLPVALANLAGEHVQDTELMMAGAVLTVLPVMLLFVFLQRYYVAGIMSGGVKE